MFQEDSKINGYDVGRLTATEMNAVSFLQQGVQDGKLDQTTADSLLKLIAWDRDWET